MTLIPSKSYYITVVGEITEIEPANGRDFDLHEIQSYVEGYIEVVHLNENQIMIVNEYGKTEKQYNPFASAIAQLHNSIGGMDYICGNVVICPSAMLP